MKNPKHRILADLDGLLAAFRRYYETKKPKFRKKLRSWLNDLVSLINDAPFGVTMDLYCWEEGHDTPDLVSEAWKNQLGPDVMLEAIKAWDKGEEYCPEK